MTLDFVLWFLTEILTMNIEASKMYNIHLCWYESKPLPSSERKWVTMNVFINFYSQPEVAREPQESYPLIQLPNKDQVAQCHPILPPHTHTSRAICCLCSWKALPSQKVSGGSYREEQQKTHRHDGSCKSSSAPALLPPKPSPSSLKTFLREDVNYYL